MAKTVIWLLIIASVSLKFSICNGGIFTWLFTKYEENSGNFKANSDVPESNNLHEVNQNTIIVSDADSSFLSVKVPFELRSSDEKFLNEVSKYTSSNLSDLDICHHRVILSLRKSCSDLTEEELSKVAVNLLNCQSAIEKRSLFLCTEGMMLSDCTKDMDQNTWNAYHIISNRVRAVCYHFRQQQFTAKTEMTVNKLVHSAEEQIDAMKLLELSQSNLKDTTSETLDTLKNGHKMLEKQQESLSSAQVGIRNYVASNIRDLTREKRLIASGQKELAGITLTIKKKLEEAQEQLKDQGVGQRNTHTKILQDLSDIQDSASRVWGQLDASTKAILLKHEQTVAHYSRLMEDLQKMNSTVHHLMDVLVTMKQKVEEKFSWISALVGDTDATVQKIYSFILHICYCLLGMIAASFLQVPYATKMALIIAVPLNALAEMKNDSGLEFSTLTIVLAVCMFFNVSTVGAIKIYRWKKVKRLQTICGPAASLPLLDSSETLDEAILEERGANPYEIRSRKLFSVLSDEQGSPTPNDNVSEDSSNAEDFAPNKYLINTSLKTSERYTSPLARIAEENRNGFSKDRYTSWISASQTSPYSLTESVRRRLLTHRDSSPPPSPSDSPSVSLSESISSGYGLSISKSKNARSNTPSRNASSQSLTPKTICSASCKNGLSCKNTASAGSLLCYRHLAGLSRESTPIH